MQPSKDLVHIGAEAVAFLGIIVYNQYKFNDLQKQIDELKDKQKTLAEYVALLESKLAVELSQRPNVQSHHIHQHPSHIPSPHVHHHHPVPPPRQNPPPERRKTSPPPKRVEIVEEEEEEKKEESESEEAEEDTKIPEQVMSSRRRSKPIEEKKVAAPPPQLSSKRKEEEKPKSKRNDEGREEGSNKIKERMARTKQIAEQMRKKREESLKNKE